MTVRIPSPEMLAGESPGPWLPAASLHTEHVPAYSGARGRQHHTPALPLRCMRPVGHLTPFHHHCHFFISLETGPFKCSATRAVCSRGIRHRRPQTTWCGLFSPKQTEYQAYSSWSFHTPDWLKGQRHVSRDAAYLVILAYKGGGLRLCLPSRRTYSQPYSGCAGGPQSPPSTSRSPLASPTPHPLEGALPAFSEEVTGWSWALQA